MYSILYKYNIYNIISKWYCNKLKCDLHKIMFFSFINNIK